MGLIAAARAGIGCVIGRQILPRLSGSKLPSLRDGGRTL
jgi:hypothetical protein